MAMFALIHGGGDVGCAVSYSGLGPVYGFVGRYGLGEQPFMCPQLGEHLYIHLWNGSGRRQLCVDCTAGTGDRLRCLLCASSHQQNIVRLSDSDGGEYRRLSWWG